MLAAGLITLGAGFVWSAFWTFAMLLHPTPSTQNKGPLLIGHTAMGVGAVLTVGGVVQAIIGT